MKSAVFFCLVGLLLFVLCESKISPPVVQIYTRGPGIYDRENVLLCHAKGFYPPEIDLQLLVDGVKFKDAKQTDLAFEENWYYHLTAHAPFTPQKDRKYTCKVTHQGETRSYNWEPDSL
uniref:Beta-2-microglobulin n=1 Tax=Periophthalmus magnuspinnatus TaxID=409849 RepID=A0A3B4ANB2_9GOBI